MKDLTLKQNDVSFVTRYATISYGAHDCNNSDIT